MATPIVTKIVMKNTTKMSLNERFTVIRAQAQTAGNNTYRQKPQLQRQASSANLRLAQQMANRPTVMAALRLKKKSLQHRLGQASSNNIKSRLNFGAKRGSNSPMFGRRQQSATNVKARLNLNTRGPNNNINPQFQGRLGNFRGRGRMIRRRGSFKPGTSPLVKARLGGMYSQSQGGFRSGRGNFQGGNRQQLLSRLPASRNARGGNRGSQRGRGGGRWRGGQSRAVPPSRQELDNQLDEYMAETKGALDEQLGQYMSQAIE